MRRILLFLGVALAAAYLLTGVRQIRPGERAVVRRFGRVLDDKPVPGLWVGLPWGMDRVDRVPVNLVRRIDVGYQPADEENGAAPVPAAGQLLTGDHNLVNVRVAVHFAVAAGDDALVHYVLNEDRLDGLVVRAVESALAEWAAGRRIDDVLIRGKAELPEAVVSAARERLRPYELGVEVQSVSVAHLLPPEEVKPAFDDVTRAHAAIRTREEDALRQAGRRLGEEQSQAYAKAQRAAAYADEQRRSAEADAVSFEKRRQEYERLRAGNADVLTALWWDQMARLFAGMRESGRLDLLDNHLGADGLDILSAPALPRKK